MSQASQVGKLPPGLQAGKTLLKAPAPPSAFSCQREVELHWIPWGTPGQPWPYGTECFLHTVCQNMRWRPESVRGPGTGWCSHTCKGREVGCLRPAWWASSHSLTPNTTTRSIYPVKLMLARLLTDRAADKAQELKHPIARHFWSVCLKTVNIQSSLKKSHVNFKNCVPK